jgi:excisionase family DNA binding protein
MPMQFTESIDREAESSQVAAVRMSPSSAMDTAKALQPTTPTERLAYSVQEAAQLLGVNYFSVYRLVQRGKLKVCRALRGKLLVPRSELLKLLRTE